MLVCHHLRSSKQSFFFNIRSKQLPYFTQAGAKVVTYGGEGGVPFNSPLTDWQCTSPKLVQFSVNSPVHSPFNESSPESSAESSFYNDPMGSVILQLWSSKTRARGCNIKSESGEIPCYLVYNRSCCTRIWHARNLRRDVVYARVVRLTVNLYVSRRRLDPPVFR